MSTSLWSLVTSSLSNSFDGIGRRLIGRYELVSFRGLPGLWIRWAGSTSCIMVQKCCVASSSSWGSLILRFRLICSLVYVRKFSQLVFLFFFYLVGWDKVALGRFSPSSSVSPAIVVRSTNYSTITLMYHPGKMYYRPICGRSTGLIRT
jgi:hypothetical protein